METLIEKDDLTFHSSSGGDWNGRLFKWKGDIYRAIGKSYSPTLEKLFQGRIIENLVSRGFLIDTEKTSLTLDGYSMVVKHRQIPFTSYVGEWSASALKDAALLILDLEIELSQVGFSIHDVNPWNVMFDGTKPIFVDLGALMPLNNTSIWSGINRHSLFPAYSQFCNLILYPLYLMAWGHARVSRSLLLDYRGVTKTEFLKLSPYLGHQLQAFPRQQNIRLIAHSAISFSKSLIPKKIRSKLNQKYTNFKSKKIISKTNVPTVMISDRVKFLEKLKREVESIDTTSSNSEWSNYYSAFHEDEVPSFALTDLWTIKNINVFKVFNDTHPNSVLDIGSNTGWYSQLAAQQGIHVISFDTDEICVDRLYCEAKKNHLNIMPLVMDFRSPSPGYGPCNRWLLPATERLSCDLVIALAVVHHLVSKQYLNFEQISQTFNLFSNKWALVEFMPPEDEWVQNWLTPEFSWYTQENFILHMKQYFSQLEVLDSYPSPRKLLLFTK